MTEIKPIKKEVEMVELKLTVSKTFYNHLEATKEQYIKDGGLTDITLDEILEFTWFDMLKSLIQLEKASRKVEQDNSMLYG